MSDDKPKVRRSLSDYWRGTKAFVKFKAREISGLDNFVDQEIADERARICIECPLNAEMAMPGKATDQVMLAQRDGRTTDYDVDLHNCDACSCPLKLTVHLDPDFIRDTKDVMRVEQRIQKVTNHRRKIHPKCWIREILKK